MQTIIPSSDYTFDASAKEITLAAPFNTLDEERILRITNLAKRAIMYDSERRTHPISMAGGVITCTYDSTGMDNTDPLQIIVDDGTSGGAGGGDATAANQTTIITDVGRQISVMEFWSDVVAKVTLTTSSSNVALPNLTISDIPAGITITRVVGMVKMRALNNTSASVNAINEAIGAAIKVEKMGGSWTSLISIGDNTLSVSTSTKEGGLLIEGNADASGEVDGNDDYEFRFDGNCRVDGNNLELIDAAVGLKVYFIA